MSEPSAQKNEKQKDQKRSRSLERETEQHSTESASSQSELPDSNRGSQESLRKRTRRSLEEPSISKAAFTESSENIASTSTPITERRGDRSPSIASSYTIACDLNDPTGSVEGPTNEDSPVIEIPFYQRAPSPAPVNPVVPYRNFGIHIPNLDYQALLFVVVFAVLSLGFITIWSELFKYLKLQDIRKKH